MPLLRINQDCFKSVKDDFGFYQVFVFLIVGSNISQKRKGVSLNFALQL